MSQMDWLVHISSSLEATDEVVSVVTSGDIDAIPIHLFALTALWPRKDDNSFRNKVHVLLQKPGGVDVYNITGIIELLEKKLGPNAGMKVAMGLCLGGNDYLPKYSGVSHDKILRTFVDNANFFQNLFCFDQRGSGHVSKETYHELIKSIYCPSTLASQKLTFEEVRQLSMKHPKKQDFARPQTWLPPKSALDQICLLVDYQVEYLFLAGNHSAILPNFLQKGCLRKNKEGDVHYYLGDEVSTEKLEDLIQIPEATLLKRITDCKIPQKKLDKRKRTLEDTPQRGARRKQKPVTSTPRK
ncbi:uncharacterized protein LOC124137364 [Haliotis rufescens]|uniref:uncharacterized protein LOC124137364 n=1 Tax=Haliotis rufescens TaxID=6454 RepID=UPI00201EC938|nr:uncharacterized protein LOC124137364 [Haliotis rufescens]